MVALWQRTAHFLLSPLRYEAAEMGGSAWWLDPGPGRQIPTQEEDHVPEEEVGWRKAVREEEVAAGAVPELDSVLPGWPGIVVSLPDAVHSRPLVGLVENWEETELVFTGGQFAVNDRERIYLLNNPNLTSCHLLIL